MTNQNKIQNFKKFLRIFLHYIFPALLIITFPLHTMTLGWLVYLALGASGLMPMLTLWNAALNCVPWGIYRLYQNYKSYRFYCTFAGLRKMLKEYRKTLAKGVTTNA